MNIIGIDPGINGGIAVIRGNGTATAFPFNTDKYLSVLENCKHTLDGVVACIEQVHAMPKQGVSSMFNFGKNFGFILGILFALKIQTYIVSPQKWKGHYGLDSDKVKSIELAHKFYPDVSLLRTPRCSKDHDGMAEALLIARYCKIVNCL